MWQDKPAYTEDILEHSYLRSQIGFPSRSHGANQTHNSIHISESKSCWCEKSTLHLPWKLGSPRTKCNRTKPAIDGWLQRAWRCDPSESFWSWAVHQSGWTEQTQPIRRTHTRDRSFRSWQLQDILGLRLRLLFGRRWNFTSAFAHLLLPHKAAYFAQDRDDQHGITLLSGKLQSLRDKRDSWSNSIIQTQW